MLYSPARAYWNQRYVLARSRERILALSAAVGRPSDLWVSQFTQLMATALEFSPDLILELGRGWGNSTCAFTEAANQLAHIPCRVVSLCLSDDWEVRTLPRLKTVVPDSWLLPLEALRTDILTFDFPAALAGAKRVFLFWDAHGFEIAESVLSRILPEMAGRTHLVAMHDLSDLRYLPPTALDYGDNGLWCGNNWSGPRVKIGNVDSAVEQAIAILDFTTRNRLTLESADHSNHTELGADAAKLAEMEQLLGPELFALPAHWFYFSLNEHTGPYTFPKQRSGSGMAE